MSTCRFELDYCERHGNRFDTQVIFVPALKQAIFHSILMDRSLIEIPADRTIIPKDVMLAIALATAMKGMKSNLIHWHFEAALNHGKLRTAFVGRGMAFSYLNTPYVSRPIVTVIRCVDRLALDYSAPDQKLVDVVILALLPAMLVIGEHNPPAATSVEDFRIRQQQLELKRSNRLLCSQLTNFLTELDLRELPESLVPDLLAAQL